MVQKTPLYGGQAVPEGVMFAGRNVVVTAVRLKDNRIVFFEEFTRERPWLKRIGRIPFIRGIAAILEASAKGTRHLYAAAERLAEEEAGLESAPSKPSRPDVPFYLSVAAVGILSFLFGKFVFTLVPPIIEEGLFGRLFENQLAHNLLEGMIKTVMLLSYLSFIAWMPPVKRLFQYHGAEHKVINAFEAGEELTVEAVRRQSRFHYRCGSSFIVFTVIVGVVVYSLFEYDSLWERLWIRIALLPAVIGVSYETLRLTNRLRGVPFLRGLGYPGLWLQKLTTKEPTDDQIEVSIASFNRMRELELRRTRPAPSAEAAVPATPT